MYLFLTGEASDVSLYVCLRHSLIETFGRDRLKDRSAVLLITDPEANRCFLYEPKITFLHLSKSQPLRSFISHQQYKLTNLLIKLRNILTLILQNPQQAFSDHLLLHFFNLILEDRLTKSMILVVVAIRTIFFEEETKQDDAHAEDCPFLVWLHACNCIGGEELLVDVGIIETKEVEIFEGFGFWEVKDVFCVESYPYFVLFLLLLHYVDH